MDKFMEIIKGRRSIRRFQEKPLPDKVLDQILDAVRCSPSWANSQCWEIIVIRKKDTKEALAETLGKNPAQKAMIQAPVVLGVVGKLKNSGYYKGEASTKFGDWFMFDLGIASQSICLAAYAFGLGSVIVGALDHNKAKNVLGVDEGYELVALIPLGYPDKETKGPKRLEISEFTHEEHFGGGR